LKKLERMERNNNERRRITMEKLKTDVVVMGTGGAGLGAAIAAAEGGAKVIVVEKRKVVGGISVTGMGIFAVESRLQRQKNVQFTRDDAFKLFMDHTHWHADAKLVRAYVDKTASTIDWLENMGVEFILLDQLTFPGCVNQTGHLINSPTVGTHPTATAHMIKLMKERAEAKGVEIRTDTAVKGIAKAGKAFKVTAEDGQGNTFEVDAEAVVIAGGGYSDNKDMLGKDGFELGHDLWVNHGIPLTGEGIRMAWELGAVPDGMAPQITSFMPGGKFPMNLESRALLGLVGWSLPYLWVNQHGERYMDEGRGNAGYISNAGSRQKNRVSYVIFDGATKRHIEKDGVDVPGYIQGDTSDIDGLIRKAMDAGMKDVFVADTLTELADKMGISQDALRKTVDEYNGFCKKGHDDLFAKNPQFLQTVKEPKFYAFRRLLGAYGTVGGIKINERAQAMNKADEVIPGLYAAGDCANGTHTYNYSLVYILWGSTLSFAINSGRIAGENAAKYATNR
jgi:fumarate reductase flavoprotein subunit